MLFTSLCCYYGNSGELWLVLRDHASLGAFPYVGPRTIQQCLDYCNNQINCVAVDIDVNKVPLGCWIHASSSDLSSDNTFNQPGTNQYVAVQKTPNKSGEIGRSY